MIWTILLLLAAVLLFRAYRNTFDVQINYVPLKLNSSERVDMDVVQPLHILHLSDLHMENLSVKPDDIIKEMKEQPIDLIAITGDLLDRVKNIPHAVQYVKQLMEINPKLGTYVVFGNHDYLLGANKLALLKSELERIGCHVLCNQTITVDHNGQKLHIIGIDDYGTRHSDVEKSFRTVSDDGLRLVLTHDPNIVLTMKKYDYDYLLCGHFHGGQIHWPKPYHLVKMGKLARMNIIKGLHYQDGRPFYISEGLGQTGVNIRLRSRPEITLHTLQPQEQLEHQASQLQQLMAAEAAPTLAIE
ncbi:MAG TPA: metallophosphoesterase [Candidatus Bathyarchaeia archaeon]|nr:metallophosphoesterase [Candidatus Bathyarchaeia archaeon]